MHNKTPDRPVFFSAPLPLDATKTVVGKTALSTRGLHQTRADFCWYLQQSKTSAGCEWMLHHCWGNYMLGICPACKKRMVSWNQKIIQQLDMGHQMQFPCILTYRLACDLKVIRLLRQPRIGNSASQIPRKIQEQHSEVWLQKCI